MGPFRVLFEVEFPLAMQLILTSIQIALVINISTATLAYVVGAGGLGDLIFTGIVMLDTRPMILGMLFTMLIAYSADRLIAILKRKFQYT
mgnify:FL=1